MQVTGICTGLTPLLKKEGRILLYWIHRKNRKEISRNFIRGEVRYSSLLRTFPGIADELFEKSEEDAKERLANYIRLAENG